MVYVGILEDTVFALLKCVFAVSQREAATAVDMVTEVVVLNVKWKNMIAEKKVDVMNQDVMTSIAQIETERIADCPTGDLTAGRNLDS